MNNAPALSGIKVLDVGTFVFGPAAATVMSDFGAEVIKVEHPVMGDIYRYLYQMPLMPVCERDYCFALDGRNKKSVTLDLTNDGAREALYQLVREADVLITNYHPSVIEKLQLEYETLRHVNERLIYAHATGYGDQGTESEKPGFDATAWWARSGLMDAVRTHHAEPALSMPAMGDRPSAMSLFGGIMMALYQRENTGQGAKIKSSLMANGAWANGCILQALFCGAEPFERVARQDNPNALVNLYATQDERWIFLAILLEERDWANLAKALGREDLITDPRFAESEQRRENAHSLWQILDETFRGRTLDQWRGILDERDVTFGVVALSEEVPDDPQMIANQIFREVDDGQGGTFRTIDSPIWIEGQSKVEPSLAPEIGQHTDEVLASIGYGDAQIEEMRSSGAIR